jgi:class 3 adenylate cyclase/YHS domain-containing protein
MSDSNPATFLFADLAGFTALTEAHGDEDAAELVAQFEARIDALLADHEAELVKSIGDAVMVRCSDAGQAIRLGVRIVDEVGRQHGFPSVRVGMHTGSAVERHGDWFGAAVNLAARVSGVATGGEVLLTWATRQAAGEIEGIELVERGRQALRNVTDPVTLFIARTVGDLSPEGLPVDPVCRMAVDPQHAVGSLRYDGREYHFCSLHCVGAFAQAPEHYAIGGPRRE